MSQGGTWVQRFLYLLALCVVVDLIGAFVLSLVASDLIRDMDRTILSKTTQFWQDPNESWKTPNVVCVAIEEGVVVASSRLLLDSGGVWTSRHAQAFCHNNSGGNPQQESLLSVAAWTKLIYEAPHTEVAKVLSYSQTVIEAAQQTYRHACTTGALPQDRTVCINGKALTIFRHTDPPLDFFYHFPGDVHITPKFRRIPALDPPQGAPVWSEPNREFVRHALVVIGADHGGANRFPVARSWLSGAMVHANSMYSLIVYGELQYGRALKLGTVFLGALFTALTIQLGQGRPSRSTQGRRLYAFWQRGSNVVLIVILLATVQGWIAPGASMATAMAFCCVIIVVYIQYSEVDPSHPGRWLTCQQWLLVICMLLFWLVLVGWGLRAGYVTSIFPALLLYVLASPAPNLIKELKHMVDKLCTALWEQLQRLGHTRDKTMQCMLWYVLACAGALAPANAQVSCPADRSDAFVTAFSPTPSDPTRLYVKRRTGEQEAVAVGMNLCAGDTLTVPDGAELHMTHAFNTPCERRLPGPLDQYPIVAKNSLNARLRDVFCQMARAWTTSIFKPGGSRGGKVECPMVDDAARPHLVAGRGVAFAWVGGQPPYTVELQQGGQPLGGASDLRQPQWVAPDLTLALGAPLRLVIRYHTDSVSDERRYSSRDIEVVAVAALPGGKITGDGIPPERMVLSAATLALEAEGSWVLEAYRRLVLAGQSDPFIIEATRVLAVRSSFPPEVQQRLEQSDSPQ